MTIYLFVFLVNSQDISTKSLAAMSGKADFVLVEKVYASKIASMYFSLKMLTMLGLENYINGKNILSP